MKPWASYLARRCLMALSCLPGGCAAVGTTQTKSPAAPLSQTTASTAHAPQSALPPRPPASPLLAPVVLTAPLGAQSGLDTAGVLSVELLIQQVLTRNPSLAQMNAAAQAAAARFPQVTSLEDPTAGAIIGPASIGSKDVDFAYRLELSQKFPWHGKRGLRGQNALAEASAAGHDVEDTRLRLVESAQTAFYDYYLVDRALTVNEEAQRLLREFRENALSRFRTGQAPQQDVLQADVEIGRQRERQLTLERMRQVAVARINTLMHLPTDAPLPPPPREVRQGEALSDARTLQAQAVSRRPDLRALADRVAAAQAALALAYKEYCPDVEVMAAYDAFWQSPEQDLRPMLGVRLNLPVRKDRRHAAVAEAQARVAQRQAEFDRQLDEVNLQVAEAYQQVGESERAVRLYDDTILPAARENVKAATAAYATGKIPFLSLVEAQRNLVGLRDRFYETTADVFRRRAALERAVGGPLTPAGHPHPQPH